MIVKDEAAIIERCLASALKVTDNAVQVMGGHGYIRENPVEGWLRHARGFYTLDGTALV